MARSIRTAALALSLALLAACAATPPVAQAPAATGPGASAPASTPAPATPVACAEPRPTACTMEYAPVCATRDTGIRCITTPCPSSEQKTFSTACTACSDPKVSSWVKGAYPGG